MYLPQPHTAHHKNKTKQNSVTFNLFMEYEWYREKFDYYVESHKIADFWPFFDLQKWHFHVVQPNTIKAYHSRSRQK